MKPLSTSIAFLLPLAAIALSVIPRPAYGDEEPSGIDPSGAGDLAAPVDGEVPPDFSQLGKPAEDPVPEPAEPASEPEPEKKVETPAPADDAPTDKLSGAAKPEEKPPEAKPDAKTDDKSKIPDNDDDIEAIQPAKTAPTNIVKGITVLKAEAKVARAEARAAIAKQTQLASEIETLRKSIEESKGQIPEELQKELEELRGIRTKALAEHDPVFVKEWQEKIEKADTPLFDYLRGHGLPDKVLEEIKAANGGPHNWEGNENVNWGWIQSKLSPGEWLRVQAYLSGAMNVRDQQAEAIKTIQADSKGWIEQRNNQQKVEIETWGKNFNEEVGRLANMPEHDWSLKREYPANATPEQKKAVDDFNAHIDEVGKKFEEATSKIYHRDHKEIANHLYRSFKADHLQQVVKAKDAELERIKARNAELESKLAAIKGAGKLGNPTPTPKVSQTETDALDEGNAETAVHTFFKNKV